MKGWIILVLVAVGSVSSTFAADGNQAAQEAYRDVVSEFRTGNLGNKTQLVLNGIVRAAVAELKKKGYSTQADLYLAEWETRFSDYFFRNGAMDLGDHAPLSEWLEGFYVNLERNLGASTCRALHFDDIRTLNFAIPVVFNPTNEAWDKEEFRRHFVPFASSIAYWAALLGCRAAVTGIPFVCSLAANGASITMRLFIAPNLSDFIYDLFNGSLSIYQLNKSQAV